MACCYNLLLRNASNINTDADMAVYTFEWQLAVAEAEPIHSQSLRGTDNMGLNSAVHNFDVKPVGQIRTFTPG